MPESDHIHLRAGRLHIDSSTYGRRLMGCVAVALMVRDGQWMLLPLHGGAGGLQIKIRNARGDRVVESQEFFRSQGLEDDHGALELTLDEDAALGGYRLVALEV